MSGMLLRKPHTPSVWMSIPEHPKAAQTADFSPQSSQRLFDTIGLSEGIVLLIKIAI